MWVRASARTILKDKQDKLVGYYQPSEGFLFEWLPVGAEAPTHMEFDLGAAIGTRILFLRVRAEASTRMRFAGH